MSIPSALGADGTEPDDGASNAAWAPAEGTHSAAGANRRAPGCRRLIVSGIVIVICLVVGLVAWDKSHTELIRKPTPAELSAAAAQAVELRWRTWPAGRIFPASVGYSTDLLSQETARRIGISGSDGCASSVDPALDRLIRRYDCRAALRATYADQLQGVVYTLGVLAFPDVRAARSFVAADRDSDGLETLALAGTAAARFDDAAREAGSARQSGPYVILSVAGYADGRPAAATGEQRASDFAPAAQLSAAIAAPLDAPAVVRCGTPEWSC